MAAGPYRKTLGEKTGYYGVSRNSVPGVIHADR